ncbi:MAG: type II/IV secretion system protein, partial [Zoogloeaceae bacterium]|nr:type II/IV secretion system protein [Zoogloeaceae bacterium]
MSATHSHEDHRLHLTEVLKWMVADGLALKADAQTLRDAHRLRGGRPTHPLIVVAEQKWMCAKAPQQSLTLEYLTEWLAGKVGLPYQHIDPLKIDFTGVADVVSSAYAARFSILPIGIDLREVVIATSEPFFTEWVPELERILKRQVKRVLVNPADVNRYLVEFFNLARSVKKAAQQGGRAVGLSSFEQLVELGRTNQHLDANDQHIVHIVD